MSLSLKNIPGLAELLESSREIETATREDAWLGVTREIAGARVRVMTVRDYTALLQFQSPFLNRRLPTPTELSFFLWVLSPEIERWHDRRGWRHWPGLQMIERWQSHRHGKRVRRRLRLHELEGAESAWREKTKDVPFVLPDDAPFTVAAKQCFEYIDEMFMDRPAALKKESGKTGLCYLTSWFDLIQSEYHLPTAEVWEMKMPVLFSRIKAIQMRNARELPSFNADRDRIMQNLMIGLRTKRFTEEDLEKGRVDLQTAQLRNN